MCYCGQRAMLELRWALRVKRLLLRSCGSVNVPDEGSVPPTDEQKKKAALDKLSSLLSDMKIESIASTDPQSLSSKLAQPGFPRKPALKEEQEKSRGLSPAVVEAARQVAAGTGPDAGRTESELLAQLRLHAQDREAGKKDDTGALLSGLFVGMKIERQKQASGSRRGEAGAQPARRPVEPPATIDVLTEHVSKDTRARRRKAPQRVGDAEGEAETGEQQLDGATRLGIFSRDVQENRAGVEAQLETWGALHRRELLVNPPPKNAYEEMVLWTEQGKLWHYPIDNEAGLPPCESFAEHVFLEELIADFPERGPIRHFMELVLVGLSKNPHISVQRKREHIHWFREYFRNKAAVLEASGLLPEGHTFFTAGQGEEEAAVRN